MFILFFSLWKQIFIMLSLRISLKISIFGILFIRLQRDWNIFIVAKLYTGISNHPISLLILTALSKFVILDWFDRYAPRRIKVLCWLRGWRLDGIVPLKFFWGRSAIPLLRIFGVLGASYTKYWHRSPFSTVVLLWTK